MSRGPGDRASGSARAGGGRAATSRPAADRIVGADGRSKAYRPLPAAQRRAAREAGIAAYEAGRFWHAHELLEPAWMGSADPAERDLDQGLIKLAAAYVHAERRNLAGMRKNLLGARGRLRAVTGDHGAAGSRATERARVDAPVLLQSVDAALARVDELAAAAEPDRDPDLLGLVPPPLIARLRGR